MEEPQKNISKTLGILIPDGCRQIYVFENESDFLSAVQSGQMIPLYGTKRHEKEYLPVFIATMDRETGSANHDDLRVVEQERDMWKYTASVYENRYKKVKGLESCQITVIIVMLISSLLILLSVAR